MSLDYKSNEATTRKTASRGFSVIELIVVLLIASVVTAIAIPQIKQGMYSYRLSSEVAMITWAIQSTRFQSLMEGYPYQVVFQKSSNTYQIQSKPTGAGAFSDVGTAVPLSGSAVSIDQDMTIQVQPNGSLSVTIGTLPLNVSYQGTTKQITVTNYGNILIQ